MMYKFDTFITTSKGQRVKIGTHLYPNENQAKRAAKTLCEMKPGWRVYEYNTPIGKRVTKRWLGGYSTNKIIKI